MPRDTDAPPGNSPGRIRKRIHRGLVRGDPAEAHRGLGIPQNRDSDALVIQPAEYGGIMRGDPADTAKAESENCTQLPQGQ